MSDLNCGSETNSNSSSPFCSFAKAPLALISNANLSCMLRKIKKFGSLLKLIVKSKKKSRNLHPRNTRYVQCQKAKRSFLKIYRFPHFFFFLEICNWILSEVRTDSFKLVLCLFRSHHVHHIIFNYLLSFTTERTDNFFQMSFFNLPSL